MYRKRRTKTPISIFSILLPAVGGAAIVLWAYLPAGDLLDRLELKTIDTRFVLRGARVPTGDVVVVAVDKKSLDSVARWPWSRRHLADLVTGLSRADARVIAIDVLLAEPDVHDPAADQALIEATRRHGGVYHAAAMSYVDEPSPEQVAALAAMQRYAWDATQVSPGRGLSVFAQIHSSPAVEGPLPELAAAGRGIGLINVLASRDGIYRHAFPLVRIDDDLYPSLAVAAAADMLQVTAQDTSLQLGGWVGLGDERRVPIDRSGAMLIDFAGPAPAFQTHSAADVLFDTDAIPADAFAGKIVLVGPTAPGLHDERPTPFGGSQGIYVLANATDSILAGEFLRQQPPESAAAVALCVVLAISVLLGRFGSRVWLPATIALLGGYNAVAVWLFSHAGLALSMVMPSLAMISAMLVGGAYVFVVRERRQKQLAAVLGRFVPPEIVGRLTAEDAAATLAGERRVVTVLFADLRGFTAASSRLGPEQTVSLLNRYFSLMHLVIFQFGGTLDKFMGDEIMAFFNAPVEQVDHAHLAVACALEMQRRIKLYRDEWDFQGAPDLSAGVGISTGEAIVGYVGSAERMQYTVIGENVNLASRLQDLTKQLGVDIIISEGTHGLVQDIVQCEDRGTHPLRGIGAPARVFEVLSIDSTDARPSGDPPTSTQPDASGE